MPPRIFLNDNIPAHRAQRGIARYFDAITSAAGVNFGSEAIVFSPEPRPHADVTYIPAPRFPGSTFLRVHDRLASAISTYRRATCIHSAYYGRIRSNKPIIITVYDMIMEMLPQHFQKLDLSNPWFVQEKRRCLERADLLIAISDSTARDIVACYPQIDPAKIVTVHLGVDERFFGRQPSAEPTAKPFLLYVGNRTLGYKNFPRLLDAYGRAGLAGQLDLRVISPNGRELGEVDRRTIERYRLQDSVHMVGDASDDLLRQHYADCYALVYPSEYEGFGLPILEAMASGTLVATSDRSSMPEVGGDVAYYFDPSSVDSIADAMRSIASLSSAERAARVGQGIARARAWSWAQCQQKTIDLYRRLA